MIEKSNSGSLLRQIRSLMTQRATDRPNLSTKETTKLYRILYLTIETCCYCWINDIVSSSSSFQYVLFHNLGLICASVNDMICFTENQWCQSTRWYVSRQLNAYHTMHINAYQTVMFIVSSEFRPNTDLLSFKPMGMII